MAFGGTTDPCAAIDVNSVGKLGVEKNQAISKAVFDFIQSKLNIPDNRYYWSEPHANHCHDIILNIAHKEITGTICLSSM